MQSDTTILWAPISSLKLEADTSTPNQADPKLQNSSSRFAHGPLSRYCRTPHPALVGVAQIVLVLTPWCFFLMPLSYMSSPNQGSMQKHKSFKLEKACWCTLDSCSATWNICIKHRNVYLSVTTSTTNLFAETKGATCWPGTGYSAAPQITSQRGPGFLIGRRVQWGLKTRVAPKDQRMRNHEKPWETMRNHEKPKTLQIKRPDMWDLRKHNHKFARRIGPFPIG